MRTLAASQKFKDSPAGMIPVDWQYVLLDSIAKRGSGHTPDREIPGYWDGGIKWVSLADCDRLDRIFISDTTYNISKEGIENSSATVHPAGVVIMSRDAGVGKSAITTAPMAVSQHFIAWQCGGHLDNLYLYYWLQWNKPLFERMAVGSTIKTIGLRFFEKLGLALPIDVKEQHRIADALKSIDDCILALEKLIATKTELRRGLAQNLFSGRCRFKEHSRHAWKKTALSNILTESSIASSDPVTGKKITIRLYGRGVVAREGRLNGGSAATNHFVRRAGQLIFSRLDFLNGAFGIIPQQLDGYISSSDLPAFDISPTVDTRWLLGYLTRKEFYERQLGLGIGGRKAKRVKPVDFLKLTIRLPQYAEQQRIADVLETAEQEIVQLHAQAEALREQKRGLMKKLLTGQIRLRTA